MTRVLVPTGVLGLGFDQKALDRGIDCSPDIIAVDGGSTDSGPYYLGTGQSKYSRASTLSEWRQLMVARAKLGVPLIIGSAGTCGTDASVEWMYEITHDVAKELGQAPRVALIRTSQTVEDVLSRFSAGNLHALPYAPQVNEQVINRSSNIVAVAGVEPIMAALDTGSDIIITGRCSDTATIATKPLMDGQLPGACWHGAKIGECGALCSTMPLSGCIILEFDKKGFNVWPTAKEARCTSRSVYAHMLYENSNPWILYEPGGYLDVTESQYTENNDGSVRVEGSKWNKTDPYTVKIEGAASTGFQTASLILIRNNEYVRNIEIWRKRLMDFLNPMIHERIGISNKNYSIELRFIGKDAVLGKKEIRSSDPVEIGVLCLITANTQGIANEIARLINPFLLHFPLSEKHELPSFAFPFSPAEFERGEQYEFVFNHIMELNDPMEVFKIDIVQVK